jgi:hypothetical protein
MTTKVIISNPGNNHQDVQVEGVGADGTVHTVRRLTDGESCEMWVHSHMSVRISEVEKAPKEAA